MRMVAVFGSFALVAAAAGMLMPHMVHRIGFLMAAVYLGMAGIAALLTLNRRGG